MQKNPFYSGLYLVFVLILSFFPVQAQKQVLPDGTTATIIKTHSLVPPYISSDFQNKWWDFGGNTVVDSNNNIRLTFDRPSQTGWVFSRYPMNSKDFTVEFGAQVSGKGTHLYGDGMAFWLTTERAIQGPVFGFKDMFNGLGIFVDTYRNAKSDVDFPYVMAMLGDGKTSYDHKSDGKANEIGGCSAKNIRDGPFKIRVTYKGGELTLDLQYHDKSEWENCFVVPDVQLPEQKYIGVTALTGELSDNHDLISISAMSLTGGPQHANKGTNGNNQQNKNNGNSNIQSRSKGKGGDSSNRSGGGGGWKKSFIKMFLAAVILGMAYIAFTLYRAKKRDKFTGLAY